MTMKKPNQIIDEITNVIYPEPLAIEGQLMTLRNLATSTLKTYQSTEDIHSILVNLDMMQKGIEYLRGAPIQEELMPKPEPEDTIKPTFVSYSENLSIISTMPKDREYVVYIEGVDIDPKINNEDLFGKVDFKALEIGIEMPVICGKTYLISQENPALSHYQDDEYVMAIDNSYIKEKQYNMTEDTFEYAFLLIEGRTRINISIYADYEEPITFCIYSHIHFKKEEAGKDGE